MDGVIDSPMRQLIREFSPTELLWGEMRHVSCVANEKTDASVAHKQIEHPLAFQFSANSTAFMQSAVEKIIANKFCMINLNAGCPAKCVIKSGSGSALMADPDKLKELLIFLQKTIYGRIPLTLKIRSGFKKVNALEIAQMAQNIGVEMLIIHPRTQPGGFASPLDFDLVARIKKTLSIPVVFSGNLTNFDAVQSTYEKTGVDGFMIGRPLWGCPWKMKEIQAPIHGETFSITTKQSIEYAIKHLELNIERYGPHGINPFKKQLPHYIRGIENASTIRRDLLRILEPEIMKQELVKLMEKW